VLGAGNSLIDISMNAHAARVERAYGRPIFAGFHAFWSIGGLAGSGVAGLMAALQIPISVHFPAAAAVLLLIALWATTRCFLGGPDQGQGQSAFSLPSKALIPLGAIAFAGFLAEGTVNDWGAVFLMSVSGASEAVASLGYVVFSIAMIAVRLTADRLTGRIGIVTSMRVAAVVTVAGFALVAATPGPACGILGFVVIGLGVAAIVPLAWSSAAQRQPENPGQAISAVATCGYLGFLIGPVLVGPLAETIGYRSALACVGLLIITVYFLAPTVRISDGSR
jgi:predicted MFS family arabinose efflux permease